MDCAFYGWLVICRGFLVEFVGKLEAVARSHYHSNCQLSRKTNLTT
jgi:hypothetical protein